MPIDNELLEILCCPETQQPVTRVEMDLEPRMERRIVQWRLEFSLKLEQH